MKQENGFLGIAGIIGAVVVLNYLGILELGSIIPDHMEVYDDFESGMRTDLWDIISSNGASIYIRDKYQFPNDLIPPTTTPSAMATGDSGVKLYLNGGEASSTKKFTTEDLKFMVSGWREVQDAGSWVVQYGDKSFPIQEQCTCPQVECICSYTHLFEVKRYDDLDLTKYVILRDGVEMATGVNTQGESLKFAGTLPMWVEWVKYEPYFSCEIDPDTEVIVRDTFCGDATKCTKGSKINTDTITYAEKKFCPQDLGALIVTDQGLTDEKGSITEKIAKGEEITVLEICPDTIPNCLEAKYVQIDYITKYVTNMKERCGVGQAYDTETQKCVQIAQQQIPDETLLYCQQTSDCIVPQKCYDATVECVNNQCDYESAVCTPEQIINEVLVIKTIEVPVPEVQFISEGVNQVAFTLDNNKQTQTVAGLTFRAGKPSVLCSGDIGDKFTANGCYQTTVLWGGNTYHIKNGQNYKINDHLSIEYKMTGTPARVRTNSDGDEYTRFDADDWKNTFIVTFNNIFDIKLISIPEKVLLNEGATLNLQIKNNIFSIPGRINYDIKKQLRDVTDSSSNILTYSTGWKSLSTTIPTDELGGVVGTAYPTFDMIPGEKYIPDQILLFGTYVTNDEGYADCQKSGCVKGSCQADGVCLLETVIFVNNKCQSNADCDVVDAKCDIPSGLCVQTNTVTITENCNTGLACPTDYECQSDGTCTKEITTQCDSTTCPDGVCENNVCTLTDITPPPPDTFGSLIAKLINSIIAFISSLFS